MKNEHSLITNYFHEHEIFSFVDEKQVIWFHGTHVCNILGYQNPRAAIPKHVEENDRQKVDLGGLNEVWFVNECGLYDLILACKKPQARPFQRWVTHDILPKIHKYGAYIDEKRFTPEQIEAHTELIESFKNNTENLLKDCRKILRNNVKLLIYGFVTNKSKSLPYNTFSQIHKQLLRMGFNYDTDRFKLAMKQFKQRTPNSLMQHVTMSDKTSLMRDDDMELFMECLYSSMRYEGDDNDTDTSSNTILFQSIYGKKYGKHTSFERFENISTHIEDAKNLIPDSNE